MSAASTELEVEPQTPWTGVVWCKEVGTYRASLYAHSKHYMAGHWPTALEAAVARDRLLLHLGQPLEQLQVSHQSQALGPASLEQLRQLARERCRAVRRPAGLLGVSPKGKHSWCIHVKSGGKVISVFGYASEAAAAEARDRLALHVLGPHADRNFPDRDLQPASAKQLRDELRAQAPAGPRGLVRRPSGAIGTQVQVDGQLYSAGTWPTEEEALIALDRLLIHLGRPSEQLQIPEKSLALGGVAPREILRLSQLLMKENDAAASRYIGVARAAKGGWRILVWDGTKSVELHGFDDEEQAAQAHDRLARHILGTRAQLNFPGRDLTPASLQALRLELREIRAELDQRASRYRGVVLMPDRLRAPWIAIMKVGKQPCYLGAWETEQDAARAYDRALRHYGGDEQFCNFPHQRRTLLPADAATLRGEARAAMKAHMTSRFLGVHLHSEGFHVAQIYRRGKLTVLGSFWTEEEAARAYDRATLEMDGDEARPNFHPDTDEELCGAYQLADLHQRSRSSAKKTPRASRRSPLDERTE